MKAKFVVSALLVLSLAGVSSAQLSGNYTIDPNGSGPNNYTTWGAAIAALGAGVSGNVVFTVASTTFQETLVFSPITGVSSLATVTFQAVGAPAILDAGASANGLTISAGTAFLNFHNLEVRNFTGYGLFLTGSSAVRGNHTFTNCKFDAPATTSSSVRAAYMQSAYQNTFTNCQFLGGSRCLYHSQCNLNVYDGCEFDGKGQAVYCAYLINNNDSDNLLQNCFFHDCSASGYGIYAGASQYGIMFWHNTIIVNSSGSCVYAGGCCAWSRANSWRNNILLNLGTGTAIRYVTSGSTALIYNDLDYNCLWAPNTTRGTVDVSTALTPGTGFSAGTLAAWKAYFNANRATLVLQTGGGTMPTPAQARYDDNSIEMDPMLLSATSPYDIHLQPSSPCIDAGTTVYVAGPWISFPATSTVATDFEGDARGAAPDIGADESLGGMLTGSGTGKVGTTVNLALDAGTGDASLPYQLASSFGSGPIPIDKRFVNLSYDKLLEISINGSLPAVFQQFTGFLDASGKASAAIAVPNVPALAGIRIFTAFATIKAGEPSNLKTISNSFMFTILP